MSWAGNARGAAAELAPGLRSLQPLRAQFVRPQRFALQRTYFLEPEELYLSSAVVRLARRKASHTCIYLAVAILLLSRRVGSAARSFTLVHKATHAWTPCNLFTRPMAGSAQCLRRNASVNRSGLLSWTP